MIDLALNSIEVKVTEMTNLIEKQKANAFILNYSILVRYLVSGPILNFEAIIKVTFPYSIVMGPLAKLLPSSYCFAGRRSGAYMTTHEVSYVAMPGSRPNGFVKVPENPSEHSTSLVGLLSFIKELKTAHLVRLLISCLV